MVPQEADEEEDYDEVSSQTHSGTVEGIQPVREQSVLWEENKTGNNNKKEEEKKKKKKGKSALSNLFHFGRQRGGSNSNGNGNGNGNGTEGERTPKVKEKEHHWRAPDWHSEEHARDREAREREEEMRRIEWEKRQEEIMQGAFGRVGRRASSVFIFSRRIACLPFFWPFFLRTKISSSHSSRSSSTCRTSSLSDRCSPPCILPACL